MNLFDAGVADGMEKTALSMSTLESAAMKRGLGGADAKQSVARLKNIIKTRVEEIRRQAKYPIENKPSALGFTNKPDSSVGGHVGRYRDSWMKNKPHLRGREAERV